MMNTRAAIRQLALSSQRIPLIAQVQSGGSPWRPTMAFPAGETQPKIRSPSSGGVPVTAARRPRWRSFFSSMLHQMGQGGDGSSDQEPQGFLVRIRVALPHVVLFSSTLLYALVGALIFQRLEQPFEVVHLQEHSEAVSQAQQEFMQLKWVQQANGTDSALEERLEGAVDTLIRLHMEAFEQGIRPEELALASGWNLERMLANSSLSLAHSDGTTAEGGKNRSSKWHFHSSLFFTATLLTSIGYGNLVPISPVGRLFCIGYGSLGIPLTLVTIADLAKFFGDLILKIGLWLEKRLFKGGNSQQRTGGGAAAEGQQTETDSEANELLRQPGPYTRAFVLFLLFSYMCSMAVLISRVQPGWGLLESLYFTLITLVTIGFGDFCPTLEDSSLNWTAAFGWILFIFVGLILSTLAVDMIGASCIERIHTLGRGFHLGSLITMLKIGRGDAGPDSARLLQQLQDGAYIPADLNLIPYIDQLLSQRPSAETILSLQQSQDIINGNGPPVGQRQRFSSAVSF